MAFLASSLGVAGIAVLVLALLAGLGMALLGLPGTLLIWLSALIYSAATGWDRLPWWLLLVLLALAILAEVSDNILSAMGVKRYGGSPKGMAWALGGGLVGAFALGAILGPPLGLVGAIVAPLLGGLVGGFAGGYWYERRQGRTTEEARRAGFGAMVGRVAGTVCRTAIAAAMAAVVLTCALKG